MPVQLGSRDMRGGNRESLGPVTAANSGWDPHPKQEMDTAWLFCMGPYPPLLPSLTTHLSFQLPSPDKVIRIRTAFTTLVESVPLFFFLSSAQMFTNRFVSLRRHRLRCRTETPPQSSSFVPQSPKFCQGKQNRYSVPIISGNIPFLSGNHCVTFE